MDPTYPFASIMNFISAILVLLPLFITSIRSGSWGISVTSFALWVAVSSIITGINAIIWSNNVRNVAQFATYISYASQIATRLSTLILLRSLYRISLCERNEYTKRSKTLEMGWTLGVPIITTLLYYVVQEHRFEIIEEVGCGPAPTGSGLSVLINIPNLVLPVISSLFYCPRIIWINYKRRKNRMQFDMSTSDDIYFRVITLGCVVAVFMLPVSIHLIISEVQDEVRPFPSSFYPGWNIVHANFSTIQNITVTDWSSDLWPRFNVRWELWANIFVAFAFFAIFGFTKEARTVYRGILWKAMGPIGLDKAPDQGQSLSEIRFGSAINDRNTTVNNVLTINRHERSMANTVSSNTEARDGQVFSLSPTIEKGHVEEE